MTIWEFGHLQSGWSKFNSGGEGEAKAPTEAQYEDTIERFRAMGAI